MKFLFKKNSCRHEKGIRFSLASLGWRLSLARIGFVGIIGMGLLASGLVAPGALLPVSLRCAERVNPLGIGDANPRLSWQLQSDGQRGEVQSAWQIQVGSTAGAADVWDSGKVVGNDTVGIRYAGPALLSGKKYFWRVRVYDGSNAESAWSQPALWSMGLLAATDWTAEWIGYDAAYALTAAETLNQTLFNASGINWVASPGQAVQGGWHHSALRQQVILPAGQTFTNAVLALYADNQCRAFVNGEATTNLALRWEATARINVTSLLHAGTNWVALSVTNTDAQEAARVIGRLVVQFASGAISNLPVNTTWKAASWPAGAWTQTNYDDSAWSAPDSLGSPWGTPANNELARIPAPYLRKDFSVSQTVTRATVYVTALGAYELHLNGQKVGDDVLTPGWSEFTKRVYYQTYDVTSLVQSGANTLGAMLGDGWYASDLAFKGTRKNYGGNPRFRAQLKLELADGSTQTVATDASWKASYGPIRFADLLLGSEYDARRELSGWDATNYNDQAWSPVLTGLSPGALRYNDVTTNLAARVSQNRLNFLASNDNLGGDPAFGMVKTLQIVYRLGTTTQTVVYAENVTVDIGGTGQALTILAAYYGDANQFPSQGGLQVQAAVTEPSRCQETLPALLLTEPKAGCYTFDLGQNMVGWVRLKVTGQAGDRITVRHGEMLNADGSIYTANLRGANATDFYILATNGASIFEPRFTFHGFRYVEVRGLTTPPTLDTVTGVVVNSDLPLTGDFTCSSPLVNRLFHNIIWGQKGNYLEVPTDCPQRDERMGWTGDAQFFVPTAAYDFDVQTFFRRYLVTLCEDAQHADGSFAHVAPDLNSGAGSAAWGDAAWICTYNMYRTYGDTNVIADHYAAFQKYGQFFAAHASNYLVASLGSDFGDWVNLGGGASGTVIDTAYYAYYAQAMSEMAAAIGRPAEAANYAALHDNIVAAFAGLFKADGSFADGSGQTGYALAFTLDLVPAGLRSLVTQKFADSIAAFDNHLATGFIGTPRLLPALHVAGRDDLAYRLLLQETYPSWLFQVKLGATTMWERWDGWTPTGGFQTIGMNSFNHYSFGAVGEYLYGTVGGINPASPSYRSIRIQPMPGAGLTWARTSYHSTRGLISTAWTNTGSAFNLEVVIPPNTTAQIFVPTTNAAAITESGVPAVNAPGVSYLGVSNQCAAYQVGSGRYVWASPYQLPVVPGIIISTTNETGATGINFTPSWGVATNGSLLAGKTPASTSGNFSKEPYLGTRTVGALTDGGSLAITVGGSTKTTSANYVTGGNGNSAGATVTYALTGATNGYDLTNIVVYGGWGDNGRDQQAYTIYYATVAAPTNFISLGLVSFNPAIANDLPSATRVTMAHSTGVLASNVVALKFDFTSPSSENGYCGYAEITAFGAASAPLISAPTLMADTQPATATTVVRDQINFSAVFASAQTMDYQWQIIRNGTTNNIAGATSPTLALTNLSLADTAAYRLVASNALGLAASTPASLTVSSVAAAVNNIITSTATQSGLGGGTFTPVWLVVTNHSLIAGQAPSSASGNFSMEVPGRSVNSLTDGGAGSLTQIAATSGYTTGTNYVTGGNGNGAGATVVYTLTGSATGYNLTNIVVYGGWADAGRDQQAYTISYATVTVPQNFVPLTSVNFNPSNPANVQMGTRVTLTPAVGALATNVVAVKFDFTTPASENGFCGYSEIALFGRPTLTTVQPVLGGVLPTGGTNFILNLGGLVLGQNYQLQCCTNLAAGGWASDGGFVANQAFLAVTNSVHGDRQKFYRLVAF